MIRLSGRISFVTSQVSFRKNRLPLGVHRTLDTVFISGGGSFPLAFLPPSSRIFHFGRGVAFSLWRGRECEWHCATRYLVLGRVTLDPNFFFLDFIDFHHFSPSMAGHNQNVTCVRAIVLQLQRPRAQLGVTYVSTPTPNVAL